MSLKNFQNMSNKICISFGVEVWTCQVLVLLKIDYLSLKVHITCKYICFSSVNTTYKWEIHKIRKILHGQRWQLFLSPEETTGRKLPFTTILRISLSRKCIVKNLQVLLWQFETAVRHKRRSFVKLVQLTSFVERKKRIFLKKNRDFWYDNQP